jgi:hypothetical protein
MISYQGTLTDEYGAALDTTIDMTFSIYSDSTGGSQLWTETQTAVGVSNGVFNVLLGRANAISDTVFNDPERWLGVQVGGDPELTPRQRIAAVGYAIWAGEADTADYARSAAGASDGDWAISGDNMYSILAGNVGIGTDSPITRLDVRGIGVDAPSVLQLANSDRSHFLSLFPGRSGDPNPFIFWKDGDPLRFATDEGGWSEKMRIASDGKVGIGTETPAAKLDVQGTLNVGLEDSVGYDVNFYGAYSGSRLFWNESKMALRAGEDTDGTHWYPDSLGRYSFAAGKNTKARGIYSTAMGLGTTARSDAATAMGWNTIASGPATTAMGLSTKASGSCATSMGVGTIASGNYSTAMGYNTTASGRYSTAIGRYVTADTTDAIVLGKGKSDSNRLVNDIENSLMVGFLDTTATLFVGGIGHRVGIGTETPAYKLDVDGDIRCGVLHETSDRRLKTNVVPINGVLERVQQLRGVSFQWRKETELEGAAAPRHLGVVAQEVEAVFPELVSGPEDGYKSVEYTKLTAVLIEAVKELQAENHELREEIEAIKAEIR